MDKQANGGENLLHFLVCPVSLGSLIRLSILPETVAIQFFKESDQACKAKHSCEEMGTIEISNLHI